MADLLLNYIILSCAFNIPYYYLNGEEKVFEHIREIFNTLLEELERRNPFDPRIREIKDDYDLDATIADLKTKPVLKLIGDLIFFPFNLLILTYILFDKIRKR